MKKILIGLFLVTAVGLTFQSLGGIDWLDSMGLRGQERQLKSRMDTSGGGFFFF